MNKKQYDIIFLMNHLGFYKNNLYNEIAKKKKILVVFLGETSIIRNKDFFKGQQNYDIELLNSGPYENRNKIKSCLKLMRIINRTDYKLLVTMSWSTIEDIIAVFISKKKKNSLLCESSIYESSVNGVKGLIKKIVVKRHSYAFVSGTPHKQLFETLDFKGEIIVTGGVGIINKRNKIEKTKGNMLRYLTIARLSEEKNLQLLIEVFNKLGKPLTLIGSGPLLKKLESVAFENITFISEIENEKLNELYSTVDVFILPSKSEPWGLVIDEAIYYDTPVIVSDRVGCRIDLVEHYKTGLVFHHNDENDLIDKIQEMENNYEIFYKNVIKLDFNDLINQQINAFVNLVDK